MLSCFLDNNVSLENAFRDQLITLTWSPQGRFYVLIQIAEFTMGKSIIDFHK